jgi:hypothetical protein
MRPHLVDDRGAWHTPFAYPIALVDPIERRYAEDRSHRIGWRSNEPWFLLGSDDLGRDELSRVLVGTRLSLGVSLLAAAIALLIGALVGATAGYAGGWTDACLMRIADVVIVLPVIYVVLALRGALPLQLEPGQVFAALVAVFALVGWPSVARGVRGIVVIEGRSEYAEAARALGASGSRVIVRHLLPATRGFLGVQATPAGAGVYHRRGDAALCRPWVYAADATPGRQAAGGRLRPHRRAYSLDAGTRRSHRGDGFCDPFCSRERSLPAGFSSGDITHLNSVI